MIEVKNTLSQKLRMPTMGSSVDSTWPRKKSETLKMSYSKHPKLKCKEKKNYK